MSCKFQSFLLSDVVNIIGGGTPKRAVEEYWNGQIPWLSVVDFNDGSRFVSDSNENITEQGLKSSSTKLLSPGQIIISARGTVGCLAQLTKPMAFNQSCYGLDAKTDVLINDYLYYLMVSKVNELKQKTHGAVFDTITRNTFNQIEIALPSLKIQEEISQILGSLDNKIELNRQINQTLEEMAQAIFKSWFVDFEPVKAKMQALENGGTEEDANLAAMIAISGKATQQLQTLKLQSPNEYQQLHQTAQLFPSAMEESELGEIPVGWEVDKIGSILKRLKPSKRYTKKQIEPIGKVPVYEQGAGILMGYHNEEAGFKATPDQPIFIFGDHTCITHLSCSSFDISQNVIPLQGNKYPTIWTYYAIQGKQGFQEYRRHWSELIIKKLVLPDLQITRIFELIVTDNKRLSEAVFNESERLKGIRDTLLPELLSSKGSP